MCFHRLSHRQHGIQKDVDLPIGQASRDAVLGPSTNTFVLYCQRDTHQQRNPSLPGGPDKGGRSAGRTSHARDDRIRVQNHPHIDTISHHGRYH
jgi:hypothetical protein